MSKTEILSNVKMKIDAIKSLEILQIIILLLTLAILYNNNNII